MGVRKGVLLGKKEFTVDLQPQVEQEFLKAFYATNQIPREILLNKPCWQGTEEKKALEEFLLVKEGCAGFIDDSKTRKQTCACEACREKPGIHLGRGQCPG